MAIAFDILDYICGLTDYSISKSVATNIAFKRGVHNIENYDELTDKLRDLLLADVLVSLVFRPKKTASWSKSKGSDSTSTSSSTSSTGQSITTSKSHGDFSISETKPVGLGGGGDSLSNSETIGGTSESRGSEEIGNISHLIDYAIELYRKWDEPIPSVLLNYGATLEWKNEF